ncbi:hypothetical protein PaG_03189 [Moesziomyces aphidis]|uniref:Uncharacterized protein n=1 Tax=Moesziomyces aphidis TaxID=84754 RepID=W3VLW1_MOEAP|nr:hypothetical protein PaG_03189 [Moesziomyces aphidis]
MARPDDPVCAGRQHRRSEADCTPILAAFQDRLTRDDSKLDETRCDSVPVLDMSCTRGKQNVMCTPVSEPLTAQRRSRRRCHASQPVGAAAAENIARRCSELRRRQRQLSDATPLESKGRQVKSSKKNSSNSRRLLQIQAHPPKHARWGRSDIFEGLEQIGGREVGEGEARQEPPAVTTNKHSWQRLQAASQARPLARSLQSDLKFELRRRDAGT